MSEGDEGFFKPKEGAVERARAKAKRKSTHGCKSVRITDGDGKRRLTPQGADYDVLRQSLRSVAKYPYTKELGDEIAQLYQSGKSIAAIAETVQIPAGTIHYWLRARADFKLTMRQAREARAFFFEDQAMVRADEADEENVQAKRLQVDTLKWAAEVNNREVFGKTTKVVGDATQPVVFNILTGVPAPEEPAIEIDSQGLIKQ